MTTNRNSILFSTFLNLIKNYFLKFNKKIWEDAKPLSINT